MEIRLVRITLGQFNATVGDLAGNVAKMKNSRTEPWRPGPIWWRSRKWRSAATREDLVYKGSLSRTTVRPWKTWPRPADKKTVVVGFVESNDRLSNAAAVIAKGRIVRPITSATCPTTAYSTNSGTSRRASGPSWSPSQRPAGRRDDLRTLERAATDRPARRRRPNPSAAEHLRVAVRRGQALPAERGHRALRRCPRLHRRVLQPHRRPGRAGLRRPEHAHGLDRPYRGTGKAFDEDLLIAEIREDGDGIKVARPTADPEPANPVEEVYEALVLGPRDYVLKNGFQQMILGSSDEIDSAVTAALAAAALGPENVQCVAMPSRFNSPETIAIPDSSRTTWGARCWRSRSSRSSRSSTSR